jgi:hypothetical protein
LFLTIRNKAIAFDSAHFMHYHAGYAVGPDTLQASGERHSYRILPITPSDG